MEKLNSKPKFFSVPKTAKTESFDPCAQGGEGEDDCGRHHGEDAGAVQHARDHGQGRGADSLRHCLLPGDRFLVDQTAVNKVNSRAIYTYPNQNEYA